jgi:hypothetical protein
MRLACTLEVPRPRFVVVHFHFFKNAGSTIESILEREFPGKFATLHGLTADADLDGQELAVFLRNRKDILAVSSHHLRYPLPKIKNVVIFDLCFIRHPLDRLQSMYSFFRSANTTDALCQMARRCSVSEFLRNLVDQAPHLVSNVQVLQLAASGRFTRPASKEDLRQATRVLRNMAVPGAVDLFDASLVAAEYFLKPAFPSLRLEYTRQNVSVPSSVTAVKRYGEWWGSDVYEDVLALNQFDLELHAAAVEEVRRRLALVPMAGEKVAGFTSRCAALRNSLGGLHLIPGDRHNRLRQDVLPRVTGNAAGSRFTD